MEMGACRIQLSVKFLLAGTVFNNGICVITFMPGGVCRHSPVKDYGYTAERIYHLSTTITLGTRITLFQPGYCSDLYFSVDFFLSPKYYISGKPAKSSLLNTLTSFRAFIFPLNEAICSSLSIILSLNDSMSSRAGTLLHRCLRDFMMEEKVSLLASVVASFLRASSLRPSRNWITLSWRGEGREGREGRHAIVQ